MELSAHPMEDLRSAHRAANVFTAARQAARQQRLVQMVAEDVAKGALKAAEVQQLVTHLGAVGEDSPEWMPDCLRF